MPAEVGALCVRDRARTLVSAAIVTADGRSTGDRGTVQTRSWVVRYNFACVRGAIGAAALPPVLAQQLFR
jgi:hypothetical protein